MFNNLINYHDVARLIWGIRHGYFSKILFSLTKGKIGRVKHAWKDKKVEKSTWWMIPEVSKHFNYLISGDENVNYFKYLSHKYLSSKKGLIGLSLGCGTGHRELKWIDLCDFKKFEAYDISQNMIKIAGEKAREKGYAEILDYRVVDINEIDLQKDYYDVIFVEQSLHHFSPLEELLLKINASLNKDGYFIINEFVGPTRFQWTDRQLEVVNSIRSMLPLKYLAHIVDGSINKKVIRPSRLSMILKDPSEAVESDKIMPLLRKVFNVTEERPYHGTVTHLLFDSIAHNFLSKDKETQRLIQLCLEIEDVLTESKEIESDYIVAVCKKKVYCD